MSIDTLTLSRELRAADFAQPQADAIAAAIGRAVVETAATKADLNQTVGALKSDLAQATTGLDAKIAALGAKIDAVDMRLGGRSDTLGSELRAEVEKTRSSLLVWFIGTQITVGALVVALIKLIPQG